VTDEEYPSGSGHLFLLCNDIVQNFFLGKMKNGFLQKYIHAILFSYLFSSFGLEVIFWN